MRAIMVMFDSLSKRMLPIYGHDDVIAENFQRLGEKTTVFTNFYAGRKSTKIICNHLTKNKEKSL